MKAKRLLGGAVVAVLLALVAGLTLAQEPEGAPLGTAFTYQGYLRSDNAPVDGPCDLQFTLWDAQSGGSQIGPLEDEPGVELSNGLFTVGLDFGEGAFQSEGRWLEIAVQCSGDPGYTELAPRQTLTPAPYALALPGLWTQQNITSTNLIGGYSGNYAADGVWGATIGGGGSAQWGPNRVGDAYGTVGGGGGNQAGEDAGSPNDRPWATVGGGSNNTASGEMATVGGGAYNTASEKIATVGGGGDNTASGGWATVGGGYNNEATGLASTVCGGGPTDPGNPDTTNNHATGGWATVSGGGHNTAGGGTSTIGGGNGNTASGFASIVGGGEDNTGGADYAFIGGGQLNAVSAPYGTIAGGGPTELGDPATANRVTDLRGTVGGGGNNQAGDNDGNGGNAVGATVAGGEGNTASAPAATVGGGVLNTAGAGQATVGGGGQNSAGGSGATVAGGAANHADGYGATIPGGMNNSAQGTLSFAAGYRAIAQHDGAFIWADRSSEQDFLSSGGDSFSARATGGFWFWTGLDGSGNPNVGAVLASGSSAWSALSDRNVKANVTPVDTAQLLARLAQVPVSSWNYTTQDPSIRHIGPMAQDFYAAFGVGEDERRISTIDADGVALAAIQGLYAENQALKAQLAGIEARMSALEEGTASAESAQTGMRLPVPWLVAGGLVVAGGALAGWRRRSGGAR